MSSPASDFDEKFRQWKAFCARPEIAEQSSDGAYVDNAPFRAIVALGADVVPLIIDKLKADPDAHFLIHALEQITGKRLSAAQLDEGRRRYGSPLGNQGYAKLWIEWWDAEKTGGHGSP
jgi:hypothetical protein